MQKISRLIRIALVLLVAYQVPLQAQDRPNKGYIGVGLGPSFLVGNNNVKAGTGLNLNLLNVGYTFGKGFGVTGTWAGGAHIFDLDATVNNQGTTYTVPTEVELSYGTLMIGPMYTLQLTDNSSVDFKARLGRLYTREEAKSDDAASESEKSTLSASLGVGYRQKIANRWCLMLSSDYYAGRQQYSFATGQNAHILNFTAGVGFVL
ncbi:outer membrane beta-barrel protein [Pontibacter actiniarum]|uniref:Outer membrane protein beta-barrel domain-containing protein n=1 Tax=Pontibacter actiniarum TaxID=323450 RepID=A0A1X9YP06_9BACT|nr:outer membrane beta-barrel protein [Pontibacter actiniarum]ARS34592.1 hypothetical protein CA264_03550 [Pontibacter actiniarum]